MVPSVTMNALMPKYCTTTPLNSPMRAPTRSAASNAGQNPMSSARLRQTAAPSAATAPTDRSKLPLISTIVVVIAIRPISVVWSRMFATFVGPR